MKLLVDSHRFLSDVRADWSFWFSDGSIARNIYELVNTIEVLEEKDFVYHVNEDHQKNDFARWISEVLGDAVLANILWNELNQHRYVKKIRKRIKEMETKAQQTLEQ
ncbi:hypothetical protein H8D36_06635 [archaeon]|nr:hypothetical protein [archaeon]